VLKSWHGSELICYNLKHRYTSYDKGEKSMQMIAVALAIGLAGLGAGIGMCVGASQAYAAIGRNPEAEPQIRANFVFGTIMAEAIAIYGLVIALLLLFKPA
jgi:F-type H+-transporting ATPase subunit c